MTWALDRIMPAFDRSERHSRWVAAPPEAVWTALETVAVEELPIMRVLLAVRGVPARLFGRQPLGPSSGSLLTGMRAIGFSLLGEAPGREIVLGSIGRYWKPVQNERTPVDGAVDFTAFNEPRWVKVATDMRVELEAGGTRLSTETRVAATDVAARRAFGVYWFVIRPWSGLIRKELLRAVAQRAERAVL